MYTDISDYSSPRSAALRESTHRLLSLHPHFRSDHLPKGIQTHGSDSYCVGVDTLPSQVEGLKRKRGAVFNLLLVGQEGSGKTTFINTLFGTNVMPNIWSEINLSGQKSTSEKKMPITKQRVILTEENFKLDLTIVETTSFCDHINNLFAYLPITDYIDEQLRLYMFQEEQPDRSTKVDNRVHACLFFINTSSRGLSPVEIETMKHISSRVNLIPVISKADTLTHSEMKEIKDLVRRIIKAHDIKICEFIYDDEVKLSIVEQVPFSLIGSESYVNKSEYDDAVLGRKYNWGVAEVMNPQHCDFIKLRDVLMGNNMVDLIDTTEAYYESCRSKLMKTRIMESKTRILGYEEGHQVNPEEVPCLRELKRLNLSFEDPERLDGTQTAMILSIFGKRPVDELVTQWSPVFVQMQLSSKRKLNEMISHEDKKFKDWKKSLLAKQSKLNKEIEDLRLVVKRLMVINIHMDLENKRLEAEKKKQQDGTFTADDASLRSGPSISCGSEVEKEDVNTTERSAPLS